MFFWSGREDSNLRPRAPHVIISYHQIVPRSVNLQNMPVEFNSLRNILSQAIQSSTLRVHYTVGVIVGVILEYLRPGIKNGKANAAGFGGDRAGTGGGRRAGGCDSLRTRSGDGGGSVSISFYYRFRFEGNKISAFSTASFSIYLLTIRNLETTFPFYRIALNPQS